MPGAGDLLGCLLAFQGRLYPRLALTYTAQTSKLTDVVNLGTIVSGQLYSDDMFRIGLPRTKLQPVVFLVIHCLTNKNRHPTPWIDKKRLFTLADWRFGRLPSNLSALSIYLDLCVFDLSQWSLAAVPFHATSTVMSSRFNLYIAAWYLLITFQPKIYHSQHGDGH